MKRHLISCIILLVGINCLAEVSEPKEPPAGPRIEMAILLDTSSSMSGLINQARTELWKVVNDMATATRGGERPRLYVSLYEYGNSRLKASDGYIRQVLPLTDDLDKVSEELFALSTSGGSEHCGEVIREAVTRLSWSAVNNDLKTIYVCGNEPFTQGSVDYRDACKAAIGKGITVNTVFCGALQQGIDTHWKDGAVLADGAYLNIDHNQAVAAVAAPQDKEIAELNGRLNTTYVAYGTGGRKGLARQQEQDLNMSKLSVSLLAQRAAAKSTGYYTNSGWDLVDAVGQEKVDLAKIEESELPEEMRKMSPDERRAYVEQKAKERAELQSKIKELAVERDKYVAAKQAEMATAPGEASLQDAMLSSLREQAVKQGFQFK